jgi:hypothetical protein
VLTVTDFARAWWGYYAAGDNTLENSWRVSLPHLIGSRDELALQAMRWFLVRFSWHDPNMEQIKADMEELVGKGSH